MSYLDVRIRFSLHDVMYNFHLLALPLFDRHTGENMFDVLVQFLNAFCPQWRDILVGSSTDGARSITERLRGLDTRLGQCSSAKLIRIWCGLHQFDLVMQRVFKNSLEEEFYLTLTALIGHLRRQQNLISSMRSTCPKVANTRWLSMYYVSDWLVSNIIAFTEHLELNEPHCAPRKSWWLFLFSVHALARESKAVFRSLQGLTTLVSQQRGKLSGLVDTYCRMTGMTGPLTDNQMSALEASETELSGRFSLTHANTRHFMDGLDLWVVQNISTMELEMVNSLTVAVAKMYGQAANGIHEIVAERDSENNASDDLPPVLPHQLVKIDMCDLSKIISEHNPRLV
jgi:hypothetical protein